MRAYPKLTGSRGIQAWIPIERGRYTYADTSAWVEKLSRAIGATVPDLVSWEWAKSERGGRARLDYTQNAAIKTLVAPYAVRPATRRAGVRADPLGGAGRPGPRTRSLDHPQRRRAGGGNRRPVGRAAGRRPGPAAAVGGPLGPIGHAPIGPLRTPPARRRIAAMTPMATPDRLDLGLEAVVPIALAVIVIVFLAAILGASSWGQRTSWRTCGARTARWP